MISSTPVNSSNIKSMGWDRNSQTLQVDFHNGSIYQYNPVSYELYNTLIHSKSIGSYFNAEIKNNKGIKYLKVKVPDGK